VDDLILVWHMGRGGVDRNRAAVTMPAKYILHSERFCAFEVPGENISFRQGRRSALTRLRERTEIIAAPKGTDKDTEQHRCSARKRGLRFTR
jgi:hypothetical protein